MKRKGKKGKKGRGGFKKVEKGEKLVKEEGDQGGGGVGEKGDDDGGEDDSGEGVRVKEEVEVSQDSSRDKKLAEFLIECSEEKGPADMTFDSTEIILNPPEIILDSGEIILNPAVIIDSSDMVLEEESSGEIMEINDMTSSGALRRSVRTVLPPMNVYPPGASSSGSSSSKIISVVGINNNNSSRGNQEDSTISNKYQCKKCNSVYKGQSGLWSHQQVNI